MRPIAPPLSISTILAVTLLAGCARSEVEMNASKLRQIVASRLHPGDSQDAIIRFYNDNGIHFTYFRELGRYEAFYPLGKHEIDRGHTLQVFIYVQKNGSFEKADIVDGYDGL
jgi:hypothetical protein